mgnify:CR=1 FL=1
MSPGGLLLLATVCLLAGVVTGPFWSRGWLALNLAGTAAAFGMTAGGATFTGPYDANPSTYSSLLIGPGTVAHLEAAIAAVAVPLPDDILRGVEAIHRALVGTDASYAR